VQADPHTYINKKIEKERRNTNEDIIEEATVGLTWERNERNKDDCQDRTIKQIT